MQYHAISGTVFRFILINVDARALRGPVSREGRVVSFHTSFELCSQPQPIELTLASLTNKLAPIAPIRFTRVSGTPWSSGRKVIVPTARPPMTNTSIMARSTSSRKSTVVSPGSKVKAIAPQFPPGCPNRQLAFAGPGLVWRPSQGPSGPWQALNVRSYTTTSAYQRTVVCAVRHTPCTARHRDVKTCEDVK